MFQLKFFAPLVVLLLLQIHDARSESVAKEVSSYHQVSIRLLANDETFGAGHICSGTLISNFTVLTSASCLLRSKEVVDEEDRFYRPDELRVSMGSLNLTTLGFQANVRGVKTHSRFNLRTYINNIAILDVGTVTFGSLPIGPRIISDTKVVPGTSCQVLGWTLGDGTKTNDLMQTDVTVVSREVCDKNWPFATFCSSEVSQTLDKCVGDAGSGVICGGVLQGIVSKGCNGDEVAQYTDVSQVYNWIFMSHLPETLKMIDSEFLEHILFSALDFVAYFINSPKIADDFEVLKIFF